MTRETKKRLGCGTSLVLLVLACAYSTRLWFDHLEAQITMAVYAAGYEAGEFKVLSTLYTPVLSLDGEGVCRAEGMVTVRDRTTEDETLILNDVLPRKPHDSHELGRLVQEGSLYKVLINTSLPRRQSTFESPRVVPYREDFIRSVRLQTIGMLVKTFWPPVLWAVVMFLFVRRETKRWKKGKVGLR